MATKPLIPTTIRTEFGEVLESEAFYGATQQRDLTFVPGYSQMRRTRDQEMKEVAQGTRKAETVLPLPVRLQWVRHTSRSGQPDSQKTGEYRNNHYRAVTKEDVGQEWLKELPNSAVIDAAGQIRTEAGDCILMVTDAKNAARNAAALHYQTQQMSRGDAAAAELMNLGASRPGSEPSVEAKPGETIRVGSSIKGK